MAKRIEQLDWSLVQAFLTVAEQGSLSAAARALGQSQPTMGRQVARAETALGVALFHRRQRGMALTPAGEALLPAARAMREAASRLLLEAAGRDPALEGSVRLTASMVMAHFVLPPLLSELRQAEPGIQIELVASDSSENLLFREADIALRMYRPGQLDVITRHLGDVPLGLYAAHSYLSGRTTPRKVEDLLALDWIGYDRNEAIILGMRDIGWQVDRDFFALRTDDQAAAWQLVRAGAGVGINQVQIGAADPLVTRLMPELPLPALPLWLAAHEAMRTTPRVARVWDFLAQRLTRLLDPPGRAG
ncbi:MAG TPA: LysR family transcriptional regulator [Aliiroseovarius sp.]|nr:LysR family transcriptional regulator [Aliiroseovarius sp.]